MFCMTFRVFLGLCAVLVCIAGICRADEIVVEEGGSLTLKSDRIIAAEAFLNKQRESVAEDALTHESYEDLSALLIAPPQDETPEPDGAAARQGRLEADLKRQNAKLKSKLDALFGPDRAEEAESDGEAPPLPGNFDSFTDREKCEYSLKVPATIAKFTQGFDRWCRKAALKEARENNYQDAFRYFDTACALGEEASCPFARFFESAGRRAPELSAKCSAEDPRSCTELFNLLEEKAPPQLPRLRTAWISCTDGLSGRACVYVAQNMDKDEQGRRLELTEEGRGVRESFALQAEKLLQRECRLKDGASCFAVGNFMYSTVDRAKSENALRYFDQGCAAGHARSCLRLYDIYSQGQTVAVSQQTAADYLVKALEISQAQCEKGDAAACSDEEALSGLVN